MNLLEVVVNGINLAVSVAILSVIALLVTTMLRLGENVVSARVFLRRGDVRRAVFLALAGIVVFLVSNGLELYGDIQEIDWTVNEAVETAALVFLLIGLLRTWLIVRISPRQAAPAPLEILEGGG